MIPIGERCEECGKIHLIKPVSELDNLSLALRVKKYKTEHRVFKDGYYASLEMNGEIWEFYLPLSVFKLEVLKEKEQESEKTLEEEYLEFQDEDEDNLED